MYFRLVRGIDCVPLESEAILLVSDWVRLKLEGRAARIFAEAALPMLARWTSLRDLVPLAPGLRTEDWLEQLQSLRQAGVLLQADEPPPDESYSAAAELIQSLGHDGQAGAERWGSLRIAIFGVEHIGAHVAQALAPLGLKRITLVDPFPLERGDAWSWPGPPETVGTPRHTALAEVLSSLGNVVASSSERVTRELVDELAAESDLLLGLFDRGFSAAHHWINRAALSKGMPALFAQASGSEALVGPWVFPGESACYMCWRMRTIAANPSFDKTMAYEQFTDRQRHPSAASRPTLPGLVATTAGTLCTEIFTTLLGLGVPSLANSVLHVDGLNGTSERHRFLHRPDCPACRGVHKAVRLGHLDEMDVRD